jgi:hypothetical protein
LGEVQLNEAMKLRIEFGRFTRKCLNKMKEMRLFEELERKVEEGKIKPESLIMETPHAPRFLISNNNITYNE